VWPPRVLRALLNLVVRRAPNGDGFGTFLPVTGLGDRVLKIRCSRRRVVLQLARFGVLDRDRGVVEEVGPGLLFHGEEPASELIEKETKVVRLVNLAFAAAALAMAHQCCDGLEVFEAGRAVYARDAVVLKDMAAEVGGDVEGLPLIS